MTIVSAYKSDKGRGPKKTNEDYIWADEQHKLFIVADGVGGQEAGDIASQLTAKTVGHYIVAKLQHQNPPTTSAAIKEMVVNAIETANKKVVAEAEKAGQKRTMSSTIVMAFVQASRAYISHAGDSRAYLIRESTVNQVTEDDVWEHFADGGAAPKINGTFIKGILIKTVGQESEVEPSFLELPLKPGDCLLLCSDGLTKMVAEDQFLAEIQKAGDDMEQVVKALVDSANAAGGYDNISVAVIKKI